MSLIHLTVVTPQGKFYDDNAQRVMVRTTGGEVAILPHHIDYSASLGEGEARVTDAEGNVRKARISGGLLHVASDDVHVITQSFEWADESNG